MVGIMTDGAAHRFIGAPSWAVNCSKNLTFVKDVHFLTAHDETPI